MPNKLIIIAIILLAAFAPDYYAQEKLFELESINFSGNENFKDEVLEKVIASKESPGSVSQFFNSFTPFGEEAVYFDSLYLPIDQDNLKQFYRANGFFEAKVNYSYSLDTNDLSADVNFIIDEGTAYHFRKFEKKGLQGTIPPEFWTEIESESAIDSTVRFSEDKVRSVVGFISNYLKNRGYMLFASDKPFVLVDTSKKKIDVEVTFAPGKRYVYDGLEIQISGEGKEHVSKELIKDIVGLKKGEFYSAYDLNLAQVRLYRTNLFSSAFVSTVIEDSAGSSVPVKVSADVGKMNGLVPEFILNNEDNSLNIGGIVSYTRKNFLGDARLMTIQASIAAQNVVEFITHSSVSDSSIFGYSDLRLILQQPFLFGKIVQTKLEGYYTLQKRREDYNTAITGIKLTLDFEMAKYAYFTSISPFINYEYSNTIFRDAYFERLYSTFFFNEGGLTKEEADSLAKEFVSQMPEERKTQTTNISLIGINFGANKTNNLLFPSRGYHLSLLVANGNFLPRLVETLISGKSEQPLFYKTQLTARYFPPVYSNLHSALGIKLKLGIIHAYEGNPADISINQRFTAGGSNSVRGWASRELVPSKNEIPSNLPPQELEKIFLQSIYPGGFYLIEGSIETRNRLAENFGSAFFLDFGNVWNSRENIRFDNIAIAVGFGFRYYSSFAPFRLDFGFKFYDPSDKSFMMQKRLFHDNIIQIHLGIGEAF
ncbi:MAG: BamA/TamA family outer membrane protein [Chlorobi bacterium]|nr:BamA/TamA family outer membrane protein [Chlorobiota bacterium]